MLSTSGKIEIAEMKLRQVRKLMDEAEREVRVKKEEQRRANIELTHEQAAGILGVSPRTVIRMLKDGRLCSKNFLDVMDFANKKARRGKRQAK